MKYYKFQKGLKMDKLRENFEEFIGAWVNLTKYASDYNLKEYLKMLGDFQRELKVEIELIEDFIHANR